MTEAPHQASTTWSAGSPGSPEATGRRAVEPASDDAPQTGDIVIDAAVSDLAAADPVDLDAQLAAGSALHQTLQARLSDLGG